MTALQQGADVVISGSGSLNVSDLFELASLGDFRNALSPAYVAGSNALEVYAGPTSSGAQGGSILAGQINGPTAIGTAAPVVLPSFGSGDLFGVNVSSNGLGLILPKGYVTGAPLNGSSTYANQTLASLGLSNGLYIWRWGNGANTDSLRLQVGPPVPAPLPLLGAAAAFRCASHLRRRVSRARSA